MTRPAYRITRRKILGLSIGLMSASLLAACSQPAAPAKPAETKPAETKPAETKPAAPAAAAQPTAAKPAETKPAETKPAAQAPAATSGAPASAFNWKQFNGQSIDVFLTLSPRADNIKNNINEFQELTGIKANLEIVPEQQARQKQVIEFTSGSTSFDVTQVSWHVQKRLFARGKWMEDLRPMMENKDLTPPDFDFADFGAGAVNFAKQADGRIDTMPLNLDPWILYCNKELLDSKGLKTPESWDDVAAAAKAIHDPSKNVFGFVARGLKNANVPVWTGIMQGWDMDPVKGGKLQTTTPEAIEAAKRYQDLLKNYAPPGVSGFNWNESQTVFFTGGAAMWFDGSGFAPPVEDPAKSKIVGKVVYALQPKGPKGQFSALFGDGMGISASSKKKGPSYLFLVWSTNKQMQARLLQAGGGAPARTSAYTNQEALSKLAVPKAWADAVAGSLKIGRPGLPEIVPVTEFRDTFGIALTNLITGADPKAELEKATADFQPVLDKSEQG